MSTMTPRERVVTALEHREPDRVPFDCAFTYGSYNRLKDYLGLKTEVRPGDSWLKISPPDELLEALHIDLVSVGFGPRTGRPVFEYGMPTYTDEWGVQYRRIDNPSGMHYDFANRVLADATTADLDDYPWPDAHDPALVDGLAEKARRLHEETDYALVGRFSDSIFERAFYMRGFEQMLVDLVADPEFAGALMDKLVDIAIAHLEVGMKACGKYIQILRLAGDDMGHQRGPLVAPRTFRAVIKPRFARLFRAARALIDAYNPSIKLMMHTDGDVYPLIPDYIEMGLDVLNPVQPYVAQMDHDVLKREFGDRLSFHGAIDLQNVMPFGTPEEVRDETIKVMRTLGKGGGLIVCPSNYMPADVPPENIVALRDAVLEYGRYPLE